MKIQNIAAVVAGFAVAVSLAACSTEPETKAPAKGQKVGFSQVQDSLDYTKTNIYFKDLVGGYVDVNNPKAQSLVDQWEKKGQTALENAGKKYDTVQALFDAKDGVLTRTPYSMSYDDDTRQAGGKFKLNFGCEAAKPGVRIPVAISLKPDAEMEESTFKVATFTCGQGMFADGSLDVTLPAAKKTSQYLRIDKVPVEGYLVFGLVPAK